MSNKTFTYVVLISLFFLLALVFDLSPYLRGPAPYPPEWRWPYLYVNTLAKLWLPLLLTIFLLFLTHITENMKLKKIIKNEKRIIAAFILAFFFFQMSFIYYDRGGLRAFFFKVAHPGMNGYFTTSLTIPDLRTFLKEYPNRVKKYPQHAHGHPPGVTLYFYAINNTIARFPQLKVLVNSVKPKRDDMQILWSSLKWNEKIGAIISGYILAFLSLLALPFIYIVGKSIYGIKVGMRAMILYGFIPSVSLFIPLPDALFAIFSILSFLFLSKGIKENKLRPLLIAGIILSIGIFFSLSLLPVLLLFICYIIFTQKKLVERNTTAKLFLFSVGILIPFFSLFLLDYDSLAAAQTIIKNGTYGSTYLLWLFYSPYDFFMFAGIPLFIFFLLQIKQSLFLIYTRVRKNIDKLFISFLLVLLAVNITGASRTETGRIWLPFIPFLVIIVTNFLTNERKISDHKFKLLLILEVLHIFIYRTYLVLYG